MRQLLILTVCVFVTTLSPAGTAAAKRVALVIGNSAYEHTHQLSNPANDAKAIATTLKRIGFSSVSVETDLGVEDLRRALRAFGDAAEDADTAVVFFAGHGTELGNENYLIPTDAKLAKDRHLQFEAIKLSSVLQAVEGAKRLRLVILDACRNNPFSSGMRLAGAARRNVSRGFARVEPEGDVLVAYASRHGTTASDGVGKHSPYTTALLTHMTEPGLDIRLMLGKVRDSVKVATAGDQVPHTYGTLGGSQFYLASEAVGETARQSTDPAAQVWATIQTSTSAVVMEAFIKQFPNGVFAALAKTRLSKLQETRGFESVDAALPHDKRQLTVLLQTELKRVGCDPGHVDGKWGQRGRQALSRYNRATGVNLDLSAPTAVSVWKIKQNAGRVCRAAKISTQQKVASVAPVRKIGRQRPNPQTYSFKIWGKRTIAANVRRSRNTIHGKLVCIGGNNRTGRARHCSWR